MLRAAKSSPNPEEPKQVRQNKKFVTSWTIAVSAEGLVCLEASLISLNQLRPDLS